MLFLHAVGHFHPEDEITNAFLEELDIGTNERWILDRVGISSRRTVLPLDYIRSTKNRDVHAAREAAKYTNAETGRRAAMMAIERAGLRPEQIGMVIAGGCSPDHCIPAEASSVAKALGLSVPAFDLHSACSTFAMHLYVCNAMAATLPDFVLLVHPENTTRIVDFNDRASAVLFGDATSAAVISPRVPARARVLATTFGADPSGADEVVIPRTAHFYQNGSAVQKFAIKTTVAMLKELLARLDPERASRALFIGHQANFTMLESVCRRAGIEPARHLANVSEFGNQAAAGAPAVLSMNWDRMTDGTLLAVVVVGSGLSWSSALVEFGPPKP